MSFHQGMVMSHFQSLNSQNRYEVKIYDRWDASWLGWFGEPEVHSEMFDDNSHVTVFSNVIMDPDGWAWHPSY
jgi:hypothetical protein